MKTQGSAAFDLKSLQSLTIPYAGKQTLAQRFSRCSRATKNRFVFTAPFHVIDDQLRRLLAAGSRWARAFCDWYQRPSTVELRGRKLLREWLSPEQLTLYDAHNYFEVTGCHTGKRYRIIHAVGANVYELDDAGRPQAGWCFVPNDHLVAGDVMLAQKIALETDERSALAVANNFAPKLAPPDRFDFAARDYAMRCA